MVKDMIEQVEIEDESKKTNETCDLNSVPHLEDPEMTRCIEEINQENIDNAITNLGIDLPVSIENKEVKKRVVKKKEDSKKNKAPVAKKSGQIKKGCKKNEVVAVKKKRQTWSSDKFKLLKVEPPVVVSGLGVRKRFSIRLTYLNEEGKKKCKSVRFGEVGKQEYIDDADELKRISTCNKLKYTADVFNKSFWRLNLLNSKNIFSCFFTEVLFTKYPLPGTEPRIPIFFKCL